MRFRQFGRLSAWAAPSRFGPFLSLKETTLRGCSQLSRLSGRCTKNATGRAGLQKVPLSVLQTGNWYYAQRRARALLAYRGRVGPGRGLKVAEKPARYTLRESGSPSVLKNHTRAILKWSVLSRVSPGILKLNIR